jgi:hypothetical protein
LKLHQIKIFILLFLVAANYCYGQVYSKIKITGIDNEKIKMLALQGLPMEEAIFNSIENSIEIILSDNDLSSINKAGIAYQISIPDMNKWYLDKQSESAKRFNKQSELLPSGFRYGSLGGYPSMAEYTRLLDTMFTMYPNFVKAKESIGKTYENRDINLVRISNYSNKNIKRKVLFTGLHHAREAASITTPLYYMFYILENYGIDPVATFILDNRELYFIPMLNPDGYAFNEATNPSGGGLWRKNKTLYDGGAGVDLNRNYGYKWGIDNSGSSPYTWTENYRGPKAFSEQETSAVKTLCLSNEFFAAINYHSYGDLIVYPWGYTNEETEDSLIFKKIGKDISRNNLYEYGNADKTVGYITNGDSDDWMYGYEFFERKIFALTIEVGFNSDYFWPLIERIVPIAKENIYSNNYIALISGPYIDSAQITGASGISLGDTADISVRFLNNGLETTSYAKAELYSEDPYVEVLSAGSIINNIDLFRKSDSAVFKITFKNNTPLGYSGKFKIKLDYDGYPFEKECNITRERSKPVEYSSLGLMEQNKKMVLTWATLSEDIHSGFVIERKLAGETYKEIALVKSQGQGGYSYSFKDTPTKTGVYYYRIKTYDGMKEKLSSELTSSYKFFPLRYNLAQNYPNPANPSTSIEFTIPCDTKITLTLYNILGEKVLTLVDEYRSAGQYSVPINLSGLSSQVYFYELKTSDFKMIKRMLILK